MTKDEEKLIVALGAVKEALHMLGVEELKNTITFNDGDSDTFDCIAVIEEYIVCMLHDEEQLNSEEIKEGVSDMCLKENMLDFDEKLRNDLIHIMKIENEPESIKELDQWIIKAGIDEVSKKIVELYTIHVAED